MLYHEAIAGGLWGVGGWLRSRCAYAPPRVSHPGSCSGMAALYTLSLGHAPGRPISPSPLRAHSLLCTLTRPTSIICSIVPPFLRSPSTYLILTACLRFASLTMDAALGSRRWFTKSQWPSTGVCVGGVACTTRRRAARLFARLLSNSTSFYFEMN